MNRKLYLVVLLMPPACARLSEQHPADASAQAGSRPAHALGSGAADVASRGTSSTAQFTPERPAEPTYDQLVKEAAPEQFSPLLVDVRGGYLEGERYRIPRLWVHETEVGPWTRTRANVLCNIFPSGGHPANCVSWNAANDFCLRLGMRLPTEAEWEWIARATSVPGKNPWTKDSEACRFAVLASDDGPGCGTGTTWPVHSKRRGATSDGVLGMGGNVAEWTSTVIDGMVVVRGGSFLSPPNDGGIHARQLLPATTTDPEIGFRCVIEADTIELPAAKKLLEDTSQNTEWAPPKSPRDPARE